MYNLQHRLFARRNGDYIEIWSRDEKEENLLGSLHYALAEGSQFMNMVRERYIALYAKAGFPEAGPANDGEDHD